MSLMLFKYALPVVIGYVLCVGISGQLWPLRKPHHLAQRPAWFLGLWAGTAVALTLVLALNMAYHLPSITISNLALPSLSLLVTAIVPGFLVFLWYRRKINDELVSEHRRQHATEYTQVQIEQIKDQTLNPSEPADNFDVTWSEAFEHIEPADETLANDNSLTLIDAESGDSNDIFNSAFDAAFAKTQQKLMSQKIAMGMSHQEQQLELDIEVPENSMDENSMIMTTPEIEELQAAKQEELLEEQLLIREEEVRAEMTLSANARLEQQAIEHQNTLSESLKAAEQECKLREEVENNLRVTRKAMVQLEARTRKLEITRSDELISLEQQFNDQIRENSKLEAAIEREKQNTAATEEELQRSREELLKARKELRKNTAARAKALASANKAVAFARQAVDARTQTESKLSNLKDRVVTQQTTISSLIKALDTEKANHKDELAFLNGQLEQKEGELDSIAKSGTAANQAFATRLVKKVAKPRTVS